MNYGDIVVLHAVFKFNLDFICISRRAIGPGTGDKKKKLHAKKEKKLLKHFWDWPFPPLKLTPTPTPPTTTDKSAFEKLRCQVAQRS